MPYVLKMGDKGWLAAIKEDVALRRGLGFVFGYLTLQTDSQRSEQTLYIS
jgi:alanine dehydrogenase